MTPGSIEGLQVVVSDIEQARAELAGRGCPVSGIEEFPWGRFVFFKDPDGNGWAVQQIPSRVRPWEKEVDGAKTLEAARAAEAAGFAWLTCSDHPAVPVSRAQAMGPTWFDAGSTLAFVAGVTTRIRLLPHVLVLPYRHPLVVAKQYGTLDFLSGGRVIVGVGSGHVKAEFKTLGADYEHRGKITDEYLRALAAAWEHDVAEFEGEFVSVRDMMIWPRPVQKPRPPIWVGGNSNAAVKRAAKVTA